MFGLHPSLEPLVPFWTAGKLAAVHATGLPAPNRSHFAAMEEVEDADPGSAVRSGWLNRAHRHRRRRQPAAGAEPRRRCRAGLAVRPAARDVRRQRRRDGHRRRRRVGRGTPAGPLAAPALGRQPHRSRPRDEVDVRRGGRASRPVKDTPDEPANGAAYPGSDLGRALAGVARVIKGDVGVAVLTVDQGDWDHHTDIGTVEWGRMVAERRRPRPVARCLPHRPRPMGRQGDRRDHQRVRPPGAGERQRRHSTTATAT